MARLPFSQPAEAALLSTRAGVLWLLALTTSCAPEGLDRVTDGVTPSVRTGIDENGTAVAVAGDTVIARYGGVMEVLDLSSHDLAIPDIGSPTSRIRIHDGRTVYLLAERDAPGCDSEWDVAYGVHALDVATASTTTILEDCGAQGVTFRDDLAVSVSGTLAFSNLRDGQGALYRRADGGTNTQVLAGSFDFFNLSQFDVNDSGAVVGQMELLARDERAVLVIDPPNEPLDDMSGAVEGMSIGTFPNIAMNSEGVVAFSLARDETFFILQEDDTYLPVELAEGVYRVTPTPFGTPKTFELIAGIGDVFCAFGDVDIIDAGTVYFEAQLTDEANCESRVSPGFYDGIFNGPDLSDAIIRVGTGEIEYLGLVGVLLGEANNRGQVALTTAGDPGTGVLQFSAWRFSP